VLDHPALSRRREQHEKTGIQDLERIHPTKPSRPGLTERIEFEYKRHGTLCLIANFDVVTGKARRQSASRRDDDRSAISAVVMSLSRSDRRFWTWKGQPLWAR
jgi:hypothetical protein